MSKCDQGGEGVSKIVQNSVTSFLNAPLFVISGHLWTGQLSIVLCKLINSFFLEEVVNVKLKFLCIKVKKLFQDLWNNFIILGVGGGGYGWESSCFHFFAPKNFNPVSK